MTKINGLDLIKVAQGWELAAKSTISAMRLKSVGKNLFDGKWLDGYYYNIETGALTALATRTATDKIKVRPSTGYRIKLQNYGGATSLYVLYFDSSGNLISTYYGGVSGFSFTTPINATQIAFHVTTNAGNFMSLGTYAQLEEGTVATPYEPYTESTQYITTKDEQGNIAELRSLPNGVKDEINVTTGVKTQRVSNEYVLKSADIQGILSLTNIDVAYTFDGFVSNMALMDGLVNGKLRVNGMSQINSTDRDNTSQIGNFHTLNATGRKNTVYFIVAKGTTLEQARASLTGLGLTYQLAVPEVSYHPDSELVCYPGGHFSIESEAIDAGDSTMPTAIVSPPPGLLLPITIESKDIFEPTYLDQDFIL